MPQRQLGQFIQDKEHLIPYGIFDVADHERHLLYEVNGRQSDNVV